MTYAGENSADAEGGISGSGGGGGGGGGSSSSSSSNAAATAAASSATSSVQRASVAGVSIRPSRGTTRDGSGVASPPRVDRGLLFGFRLFGDHGRRIFARRLGSA